MDDARHRGAVFTPHPLAHHLAAAALDGAPTPRTACDLAAGDGRLLAALRGAGAPAVRVFAADLDPEAWATGALHDDPTATFVAADAVGRGLDLWPGAPPGGVDVAIGNPPFLTQLSTRTARSADQRRRAAALGAVAGLADTSAAFLLAACDVVRPGGRVAMIMPLSFLTATAAAPVRQEVHTRCHLVGVWVSAGPVFPDASVETCALILERATEWSDAPSARVRRWRGRDWQPAPPLQRSAVDLGGETSWAPLVVDLLGDLPAAGVATSYGRLGDLARATAGFRDQFYGLAPLAREVDGPASGRADSMAPLVTSGAIDPGRLRWSTRTARIAGRDLLRPAVGLGDLDAGSALCRWVNARLVPKVLVATQTPTIEAVPDPTGEWIPSTPVVSVECHPDLLWHVLAALGSPAATLWARRHFTGAALSTRTVKLSARQVLQIPLPPSGADWDAAAELWRRGHDPATATTPASVVIAAGERMAHAHGLSGEVLEWWRAEVDRRLR